MRLITLTLAAVTMAAVMTTGVAVAQELAPPWKMYPDVEQGFLLMFPGEPEVTYPKWELVTKREGRATVYTVKYNGGTYKMTTADATDTFIPEDLIITHAIELLSKQGKLNHNEPTRVQGTYGREISIDMPGGGRDMAWLFYANERLYIVEAIGNQAAGADMFRYGRSLVFDGNVRNRSHAQLDAYWQSCPRGADGVQLPLQPSGYDDPRCEQVLPPGTKVSPGGELVSIATGQPVSPTQALANAAAAALASATTTTGPRALAGGAAGLANAAAEAAKAAATPAAAR